eukprot:UN15610
MKIVITVGVKLLPSPQFDVSNKSVHESKISYTGIRVQQTSLKPRGGSNLTTHDKCVVISIHCFRNIKKTKNIDFLIK